MCACGTEIKFYGTQRLEMFGNLEKVKPHFLSLSAKNLILSYGSRTNSENLNQEILENVISYLKAPTRFDRTLIDI